MTETERGQRGQRGQDNGSSLQTDRGSTTINDAVVVSIAGAVVQEVSGAEPEIGGRGTTLPGDNSPTVGEFFGKFTGGGGGTRGVSVEVSEAQAAIDLTVTVPYGRSIPEVTKSMRPGDPAGRGTHRPRGDRGQHHRQGRLLPSSTIERVTPGEVGFSPVSGATAALGLLPSGNLGDRRVGEDIQEPIERAPRLAPH